MTSDGAINGGGVSQKNFPYISIGYSTVEHIEPVPREKSGETCLRDYTSNHVTGGLVRHLRHRSDVDLRGLKRRPVARHGG